MKRIIATLAMILLGVGVAVVIETPASASRPSEGDRVYVPPVGCQTLDIPTTPQPWIIWQGGYHQMGTFRMARNCGLTFTYKGDGTRLDNSSCVTLRLKVLGADWVFDYYTETVEACGIAIRHITDPRLRVNDRFYINIWATNISNRHKDDWGDGSANF
jgi:hypothetical protein